MGKKQRQWHTAGGILNPMVSIGIRNNLIKRRRKRGRGIVPLRNIPYHVPGGFQQEDFENSININKAHHCTHSSSVIST